MKGSYKRAMARGTLVMCIAALCVALLALAGCGGSSGSSASGSGSADASGSASASAEASAEASSEATVGEGGVQGEVKLFVDSSDRAVTVPATIDRVAVTGPISQMGMLVFAPEKMVGLSNELSETEMKFVGEQYGFLPVYGQIYGGKGDFNKEAVASADPQIILDIGEAKKTIVDDLDQIQSATGIPCVHIEATYDTYAEAFRQLGELLGEQERANELSEYCTKAIEDTNAGLAKVDADQRVKVAYLLGDAGLNAMAKGSFQATVVDAIASNVTEVENAGGSGLGSEVSFEQIALWDPQMIIFAPDSIYDKVADDESWSTLTAIKDGNYYAIPGEPYNWISSPPGINQVLGYQWFARLCYPDQFDDSIESITADYYKTLYGYELSEDELSTLLEHAGASK